MLIHFWDIRARKEVGPILDVMVWRRMYNVDDLVANTLRIQTR
jgi:hypothetical protein